MTKVLLAVGTAPHLGIPEARKAARGGGGVGWGQAFDSASSCWYRSLLWCWLSLRCQVHEMTPPLPRCTSLSVPRYRIPAPQARSRLPLQLLLLLLWAAADIQGHPKSGPRISVVWKGRWRTQERWGAGWGGGDMMPHGWVQSVRHRRGCMCEALWVPSATLGERMGLDECKCAPWHTGVAGTLRESGWWGRNPG